jgi:Protein of unknown function (DUF4199)
MIDEGTAFCPHCGAPQIRVAIPQADVAPANDSPAFVPGTPAEMQPPAQPVPLTPTPPAEHASRFEFRLALPTTLIAGLVIGIGTIMPLGSVAWIVLVIGTGGALAVALYKRKHPEALDMRPGEGAKLGAMAAVSGYILFAILAVITFVVDHGIQQEMIQRLHEMKPPDPSAQQMYQQIADKLSTPEGMALLMTFAMAIFFFMFLALGAAGGAIGATLMHRDHPQQQ